VCGDRFLVIPPSPSFFWIWEGGLGKETGEGNGEGLGRGLEKLESERISFTGLPLFINVGLTRLNVDNQHPHIEY
jgi:hypothetical protein